MLGYLWTPSLGALVSLFVLPGRRLVLLAGEVGSDRLEDWLVFLRRGRLAPLFLLLFNLRLLPSVLLLRLLLWLFSVRDGVEVRFSL